jgi:hypothetical protein
MDFITFLGVVFIGVVIDRLVLLDDSLNKPKETTKTVKKGNYYVK